jgi:hypothetical protein
VAAERRHVRRSELFLETAHRFFPPGGSVDGQPSFEMFADGPLRAVEELCARAFEEMSEPYPGIRAWTTIEAPFFAPMTFYAVVDTTGVVELIDVTVDTDYEWDSPGDSAPDR